MGKGKSLKLYYNLYMKKQNGFTLIILILAVAIIVIVFSKIYFSPKVVNEETEESKTLFEQQTDAIQQAEDIKEILEKKSKIE